MAEPEPSFLTATMLAAQTSGFALIGLAVRGEQEPLQIHWRKNEKTSRALALNVNFIRKALRQYLNERAEPAPYLHLHAAALAALSEKGMLRESVDNLAAVDKAIVDALQSQEFIDLEKRTNPTSGLWTLRKRSDQATLKGI
jgi:hypothetical protein